MDARARSKIKSADRARVAEKLGFEERLDRPAIMLAR